MKLLLPSHSEPCHSVVVYDGAEYVEDILQQATRGDDYLDVSKYLHLSDPRFEHSPASLRGERQPPEYRAIARLDGIWYPYNEDDPDFGLPPLKVTDPRPADELEADGQDDGS